MDNVHLRQLDICSPMQLNEAIPLTAIVGLGGIGSSVFMALAKMGLQNITGYDFDTLEEQNYGNQFLPIRVMGGTGKRLTLGSKKSMAMTAMLDAMIDNTMSLAAYPDRFVDQFEYLTIVTVDSMETRKAIWANAKEAEPCIWYIDARMGAEVLRIFTVNMMDQDNMEWYESTLYTDEEAEEEPCTARGIVYTSMLAGGLVAHTVKQIAVGPTMPPRELSFIIQHGMLLKTGQVMRPDELVGF